MLNVNITPFHIVFFFTFFFIFIHVILSWFCS